MPGETAPRAPGSGPAGTSLAETSSAETRPTETSPAPAGSPARAGGPPTFPPPGSTGVGSSPASRPSRAAAKAEALGIRRIRRHIFLCVDATRPNCCDPAVSRRSWEFLKQRLKSLGAATGQPQGTVNRTKADCLRICAAGPVAVVYPEGVWYCGMDEAGLEEVIERHLLGGEPVEERRIPNT